MLSAKESISLNSATSDHGKKISMYQFMTFQTKSIIFDITGVRLLKVFPEGECQTRCEEGR